MQVFAIMFESEFGAGHPRRMRELAGEDCLFTNEGDADRARDSWNSDYPHFNNRTVVVTPLEVK